MSDGGKLLLIANNFPPVRGGSAVVYENLARYAGGRIVVLAPRVNYVDGLPLIGWREHDRLAPYRVVRLPLLRTPLGQEGARGGLGKLPHWGRDIGIRLRVLLALLRVARQERVQAVCIGELLASGWLLSLLRRFAGLRRIAYVHGEEITTEDRYDPGHRRARRALAAADCIVAVSRFTEGELRRLLGGAAQRISLIENGVDGNRFHPREKSAHLLGLYDLAGRFVFVSVCRLLEKKGVDHAISAFAQVVRQRPGCRYLVVGTGPHAEALRARAVGEGVAESVVFVGDVPEEELAEHYCLGDVFVMPNRQLPNGDTEGFGLVFLEANACGLPVVAGRDGGSRDAVRDGANGLIVDGNDIAAIAAAMLRLHDDAALRARIRAQGLAAAAAADWRGKAREFLALCTGDEAAAG